MAGVNDIWQTFQQLVLSVQSISNQLKTGLVVDPVATSYTVAMLPVSGAPGQTLWASNGRKPAEGSGAGTGVPVFWNSATTQWYSYLSGTQVTS
jgi:hypothetical protein